MGLLDKFWCLEKRIRALEDGGVTPGPADQLDGNGTIYDVDVLTEGEFLKVVGGNIVTAAVSGGSGEVEVLESVTGYTGGGATNLDGVATVALTKPKLFFFYHPVDGRKWYWMRTKVGGEVEDSPNLIIADDDSNVIFEDVS